MALRALVAAHAQSAWNRSTRQLTRAGRKHDYVLFPGAEHNLGDPQYETEFLERVGAFLDKHNPS